MPLRTEEGTEVPSDAYGTYIAFSCPGCGHPILATIKGPVNICRGTESNPVGCPKCNVRYYIDGQDCDFVLHQHHS